MILKHNSKFIILTLAIVVLNLAVSASPRQDRGSDKYWGPRYSAQPQATVQPQNKVRNMVTRWNQIAIDASGLDHMPVQPGEDRVFGEQLGPVRAARAVAIAQIAVFEALNATTGDYESYIGLFRAAKKTDRKAAIAQAAHDALVGVFPSQKLIFDAALAEDLNNIPDGRKKTNGINLGKTAAQLILLIRSSDHSQHPEMQLGVDYFPSNAPGKWRQDPISLVPIALGARWNEVTPFVMTSAAQFRIPPPPAMESAEYAAAYNEVKRLGGDGINTPTERTADQTEIGIFWAYDGTPSLCAPPRLYNQILVQIADQMNSDEMELARLLALANTAMADAGIASWESKFFYNFWRPIGGVREADEGTGPSGLGDGNPGTICDVNFMPLGAPASNLNGPNFTPPFPAYPSGHATFGGALFQTLRRFYGTDNIAFTFVSDELNGVTRDNSGNVRPLRPRSFTNLSQPEEENGQSRIYLGIHWSFDKTEGISQGRNIANWVFDNAFRPVN